MWLKKFLSLFALNAKPIKKTNPTKRKLCEETLLSLDTDEINYSVSDGKQVLVSVRYTTIEEYIHRLKEAQVAIKRSQPIPPEWFSHTETTLSVDRFMISTDGYYIDIPSAIREFKKEALNLCQLLEAADTERVGLYEHCARVLMPLFINVTSIIKAINEVTHHQ